MARPRSITDDRLIEAAQRVVAKVGPGFTLAKVAEEAGVAVGSVATRFGSKHGLLEAMSRAGTERAVELVRGVSADAESPCAALRTALLAVYSGLGDPETAANHLGQLGADIADPLLRELVGEHYAALERELTELVRDAAGTGWCGPSPRHAARVLLATANGSAIDWSIRPGGEFAIRLAEDVDSILRSWYR
ncbi:TetR family transcriptional regulator [Prauserella marina]|uniref:TetR/AcrR family transcriptional regulator n=1 Tax=Prauserella marina TaxID=530584 RepID=UPI000B88C568|nr:TetR/AcrR family transcriptional regulator [Prauserella marina]ASR38750.1 TetR family transcriptional regulator [Prauserella marina]